MKICLLTDAWTPIWGGGQKHIWEVASRLTSKHSCQIDVLVPNFVNSDKVYPRQELYNQGNLQIIRLGRPFVFPNLIGRSLFLIHCLTWVISHDYDIVHSHAYQFVILPLITIIKPNIKVVYTLHGAGVNLLGGGILNSLKIPQFIWKIFVYSYPYDLLCSVAKSTIKGTIAASKFAITPNGVNVSEFDRIPVRKDSQIFQVLWVGRPQDPVKGLLFLQKAIEKVQQKYPDVKFNIVSGKPHHELVKEYKTSNLFVLPSLSEGLPLTLLEAMAAKLPVICTDVGDCAEIIRQSGAGLIVPPGNIDSLKEAILKMVMSKNLDTMGQNGYEYVKKNFSWEKTAQQTWALYQNLVDPLPSEK